MAATCLTQPLVNAETLTLWVDREAYRRGIQFNLSITRLAARSPASTAPSRYPLE